MVLILKLPKPGHVLSRAECQVEDRILETSSGGAIVSTGRRRWSSLCAKKHRCRGREFPRVYCRYSPIAHMCLEAPVRKRATTIESRTIQQGLIRSSFSFLFTLCFRSLFFHFENSKLCSRGHSGCLTFFFFSCTAAREMFVLWVSPLLHPSVNTGRNKVHLAPSRRFFHGRVQLYIHFFCHIGSLHLSGHGRVLVRTGVSRDRKLGFYDTTVEFSSIEGSEYSQCQRRARQGRTLSASSSTDLRIRCDVVYATDRRTTKIG